MPAPDFVECAGPELVPVFGSVSELRFRDIAAVLLIQVLAH